MKKIIIPLALLFLGSCDTLATTFDRGRLRNSCERYAMGFIDQPCGCMRIENGKYIATPASIEKARYCLKEPDFDGCLCERDVVPGHRLRSDW